MLSNADKIEICNQRISQIQFKCNSIIDSRSRILEDDPVYAEKNAGYSELLQEYAQQILAIENEKISLTS